MTSKRIHKTIEQNLIALDTELQRELLLECQNTGKDIQDEFKDVVKSWKNKPKFRMHTEIGRRLIQVTVEPETFGIANNIWRWIDQGTGKYGKRKAPYPIRPKRANTKGVVTFRTGYSPKTAPIAKANAGSGTASGFWISKKVIYHPGIRPRKFTETISKRLKPPFATRVNRAIKRAIMRAARA